MTHLTGRHFTASLAARAVATALRPRFPGAREVIDDVSRLNPTEIDGLVRVQQRLRGGVLGV